MVDNVNAVRQWIRSLPGDRTKEGELGGWDGCQRAGSLKPRCFKWYCHFLVIIMVKEPEWGIWKYYYLSHKIMDYKMWVLRSRVVKWPAKRGKGGHILNSHYWPWAQGQRYDKCHTFIKGNLYFSAVAISLPLILLTWRSSRRGKKRHTFIFLFTSLWEPTRKIINNKVAEYLLCVNTGSCSGGGLRWGVTDLLLTGLPYRSYRPTGKNGLTQRNRSNSRRW